MKHEANNSLKVMLWGQEIGRLAWHQSKKTTYRIQTVSFAM